MDLSQAVKKKKSANMSLSSHEINSVTTKTTRMTTQPKKKRHIINGLDKAAATFSQPLRSQKPVQLHNIANQSTKQYIEVEDSITGGMRAKLPKVESKVGDHTSLIQNSCSSKLTKSQLSGQILDKKIIKVDTMLIQANGSINRNQDLAGVEPPTDIQTQVFSKGE